MHSCQSDFLNFYSFLPYLLMSSPVSKFMHWLNISTRFRDGLYHLVMGRRRLGAGRNAAHGAAINWGVCAEGRRLPLQHP